jgi:hypothetical protein
MGKGCGGGCGRVWGRLEKIDVEKGCIDDSEVS